MSSALRGRAVELPSYSILTLIQEQAKTGPCRAAIEHNGDVITYAELWMRSSMIASAMKEHGVEPGRCVAVWADRTPDAIASMLAAMRINAPYVPVDPSYPAGRIAQILRAAKPALAAGSGAAPDHVDIRRNWLDTTKDIESHPIGDGTDEPQPADIAYIIFTSGTSGAPKGVTVSHRSLLNYTQWCVDTFCRAGSGVPLFASLGFDHAVTCIWPVLAAGNQIVLAPGVWNLGAVFATRSRPFSFIKLTPSHCRFFEQVYRPDYQSLTGTMMFGGESLDAELVEQIKGRLGRVRLINHYGPTEATVGCLFHRFTLAHLTCHEEIPIGRPIWNTRAYVVDSNLRSVKDGEVGELIIAGTAVADGYLHGGDGSSSFMTESELGGPAGPAYRTGDLVRLGPEGVLAYQGRIDDQIKLGGYRIELSEIRHIALKVDGVLDASVRVSDGREKKIELELIPSDDCRDISQLVQAAKSALRRVLPSRVVPSSICLTPHVTFNTHGKRQACRRQDMDVSDGG